MIVLDTHSLIWMDEDSPRLGREARASIERAFLRSTLAVSAISFWECAMLVARARIALPEPVEVWRKELLGNGLVEIPLNGTVAIQAAQLQTPHRDPADRLIAATAMQHQATLVTADERLLTAIPGLKVQDARR